jgi:hypothetical protein
MVTKAKFSKVLSSGRLKRGQGFKSWPANRQKPGLMDVPAGGTAA